MLYNIRIKLQRTKNGLFYSNTEIIKGIHEYTKTKIGDFIYFTAI